MGALQLAVGLPSIACAVEEPNNQIYSREDDGDLRAAEAEARAKAARNYGGEDYREAQGAAPWHEHFGFLVASCERGDLRPTPRGIEIFADRERRFVALDPPAIPRVEVIDELYAAVFEGRAPLHGARWGLATLEVCTSLLQSAREGRDVALARQVAVE